MAAVPRRQKACIPCAESKRRCDKETPECHRCIEKGLDCAYPQPKKRRRDSRAADATHPTQNPNNVAPIDEREQAAGDLPLLDYPSVFLETRPNAVGGCDLDFGDWRSTAAEDFEMSFFDNATIPYASTVSAPIHYPDQGPGADINDTNLNHNSIKPCSPFFLRDETLAIYQKEKDPTCVNTVEMEPFISEAEKMLQSWVTTGSSGFIHRRLYDKGMPTCVQDAFTTYAAYANRTPATKETILQIADDRASALTYQAERPVMSGVQEIWAHLARVHALFVYVFIRAFDGSVRMRASAEHQIPTLRSWLTQMWETVQRHKWDNYPSVKDGRRPLLNLGASTSASPVEFHDDFDRAMEIWQLWILTESVRRTHLIIRAVLNTFQIMQGGWAECKGHLMCTVRRGLWEADSAMRWFRLCRESGKCPLMAPSLMPRPLMSQYSAGEFDDFVILCWSFVVGTDKIQCWVDKTSSM
ncbi:hypothetical protein F5Y14DRAFT_416190 [Nemania sp. NC0429]|nr:hypothetical protein F5Y14DRAFT_416190 [Nemania sp. NC0429]